MFLYELPASFLLSRRSNGFLKGRLYKGGCWVALGDLGVLLGNLKLSLEAVISLGYMIICASEDREDWIVWLWNFEEVPPYPISTFVSTSVRILVRCE